MSTCPCGAALPYEGCCGPFHRREREAPSPEALMRSRYAAFVMGEHDYLYDTLHPDHDEHAAGRAAYIDPIARARPHRRYLGLEILETREADAEGVALVRFAVRARERDQRRTRDVSFTELSRFVHDGKGWRYLFGTMD